jgi:cell division protease FtsH
MKMPFPAPKKNLKNKRPQSFLANFTNGILLLLGVFLVLGYFGETKNPADIISVSQVALDVRAGLVEKIKVNGDDLTVSYRSATSTSASSTLTGVLEKKSKKEALAPLSETLANYGVTAAELEHVEIAVTEPSDLSAWALNLAPFVLSILGLVFVVWFFSRQVKGANAQALSFGSSRARMINPDDTKNKVTFKDVAGAKEAKQELQEIVDFLKNPKKFIEIGAVIPKGVLLMGAPGTGKTLLARAVAGEAGVSFFSISGSEFVEMFVGVGASRVRDLFLMAKQVAPAIIFIDEIDAVGRSRGVGIGGGNDEREQTLNQILVEMDGFEPNEKVIIMAATNRPDVLDPALLRPGRFDRRVTIDVPDRNDREEIIKIHARKKPLAEDVNLRTVAERTPGFSGADLYSVMNESAIFAAREDRQKIGQFDLIRAIEKVMLGPERKSHILSDAEKRVTAYHEAGHALVASLLKHADPVHKISIISRGRAAGYTLKLPIEDRKLQSRNEFLDDIAMSLGGYVAEKLVMGDVTTGPQNDLQVSTALARDMVTRYGMSEKVGVLALESGPGKAMFGKGVENREYSEAVASMVDAEVSKIMSEALSQAETILTEKKAVLDAIALKLIEVENLEQKEYEELLLTFGIVPAYRA